MNIQKGLLLVVVCILFPMTYNGCKIGPNNDSKTDSEIQVALTDAFEAAGTIGRIKSLVVSRNGAIIREQYWHGGGSDLLHDVRSVTKSITSALVGIAIEQGLIENVNVIARDYLSRVIDIPDGRMNAISLHHLLSMSCGLEWHELDGYSEYNTWTSSPNQMEYVVNKQVLFQPGEHFTYSTGAAHLISAIMSEVTGVSIKQFAEENLFNQLGIGDRIWHVDKQGYHYAGSGLSLTPNDMINFGNLFLNRGMYNGHQIINSDWIDLSTCQKIATQTPSPYGSDYGYYWWLDDMIDFYFASGYGGQFIVVVPNIEAVIVATCHWSGIGRENADNQWMDVYELIINRVIPAFL
jgi:CubicO group peptidase (beta-lactamase class C family)